MNTVASAQCGHVRMRVVERVHGEFAEYFILSETSLDPRFVALKAMGWCFHRAEAQLNYFAERERARQAVEDDGL